MMDECCDAADADGFRGVGDYISRKLEELEEARRSDDRGTRAASFPWWKIVWCAAVLGITVALVLNLLSTGAPWWAFFLVALLASIFILLGVLGCESRTR
jgi:hypothetical protein